MDATRDEKIRLNPEGIVLMPNTQSTEIKISRKEAERSETLVATLSGNDSVENRLGWTEEKYRNEPLLQIEIPIPFSYKDVKMYVDSFRDYKMIDSLTEENQILLLKLSTWFGDTSLINYICTLIKHKYKTKSYSEILAESPHKTKITHLGRELTETEKIYESILTTKFPSPYEYVLFSGGYFIATLAHSNSTETLGRIATYMPNAVAKITKEISSSQSSSQQTYTSLFLIEENSPKRFKIVFRKITIPPYEYIYGHITPEHNNNSIDSFTSLIPSPGRLDNPFTFIYNNDIEQMAEDEMNEMLSKITLNETQIISLRRESYSIPSLESNKQITKILNAKNLSSKQILTIKKLSSDPNFILDHISNCYDQEYDQEYKCIPIQTCPFFSQRSLLDMGTDVLSFRSYVIMETGWSEEPAENGKAIFIDTQSPYKSYIMRFDNDVENQTLDSDVKSQMFEITEIQVIDENRFLLIAGRAYAVALFDIRKLKDGSPFRPDYLLGDDEGSLDKVQIFDSINGKSGFIFWRGEVHSIDDGRLLTKIPDELTEDSSFDGDYIGKIDIFNESNERKVVIKIFSLIALKFVYIDEFTIPLEEKSTSIEGQLGLKYFDIYKYAHLLSCEDNPNIVGILKQPPESKTQIITIIRDNRVIKTIETTPFISMGKYLNLGIIDGKIIGSNSTVLLDLQLIYPHIKDEYATYLLENVRKNKKITSLEEKILKILSPAENKDGESKILLQNIEWLYDIELIGENDAILILHRTMEKFFYDSGFPKMKCYKYTSHDNKLTSLGCEGGRIYENKTTRKLVVEYGYSGFPEVWI